MDLIQSSDDALTLLTIGLILAIPWLIYLADKHNSTMPLGMSIVLLIFPCLLFPLVISGAFAYEYDAYGYLSNKQSSTFTLYNLLFILFWLLMLIPLIMRYLNKSVNYPNLIFLIIVVIMLDTLVTLGRWLVVDLYHLYGGTTWYSDGDEPVTEISSSILKRATRHLCYLQIVLLSTTLGGLIWIRRNKVKIVIETEKGNEIDD